MIEDVLIKNFKCFEKLSIPELQRVTLIGGRNNVGKTALLEAIFLFLDRLSANMIVRQYGWRGIEGVRGDEAMFSPIFRDFDLKNEVLISATMNKTQEDARFKFNPNYIPPAGFTNKVPPANQQISTDESPKSTFALDITYERHDGSKQDTSHLTVHPEHPERGLTLIVEHSSKQYKAIFLAAKKHTAPKETSEWFSDFAKESREWEIVEFLKIIEPRLETLKVVQEGPGPSIHGKLQGLARTLDVHFMGEGMEKLLNIALAIAQAPGRSIFVDEFENGLHYSSLPKIWSAISKMLVKYDCQLFTTTHSQECIRSAHEGLMEMSSDFRYIRLDRSTGNIEAKIFNYEMLGDALISNLEIR